MNCNVHREEQKWEVSEGAALCYAELARWNDDHARALVADCAPQFVACFEQVG